MRVLHTRGVEVLASRGLDLFRSIDGGVSYTLLAHAWRHTGQHALALTPVAARFLRAGIHGALPLADGGHVAIVRDAVLRREADADCFHIAHHVLRGTRPLNVCASSAGPLYFGEYFANPQRDEVYIYASDDGRSYDVAHVFPAGAIRHVHSVIDDPLRRGLWVLTGDNGDEAGIWWTDDQFRTLTPVVRGVQAARAVSALPTPKGLIVPSDAPDEPNFVRRLDPRSGVLEPLAYVPGSVFSVGRTENLYLVSTAVEPSSVNLDPRVALFGSPDGERWAPIARFERDLRFLRDRRGYLQYPMVLLPDGVASTGRVLATGQSLAGLHGRTLAWSEAAILHRLGLGESLSGKGLARRAA